MLDRAGYRPNVCIVLVNDVNNVLMCRRLNEKAWQFPQGGILYQEKPKDAMYRELFEEIGLLSHQVQILGRTQGWLHYNVPKKFIRSYHQGIYKGQKQIWYLLKLIDKQASINLFNSDKPEFDDSAWYNYWSAINMVIDFKKEVYENALHELYLFLENQ